MGALEAEAWAALTTERDAVTAALRGVADVRDQLVLAGGDREKEVPLYEALQDARKRAWSALSNLKRKCHGLSFKEMNFRCRDQADLLVVNSSDTLRRDADGWASPTMQPLKPKKTPMSDHHDPGAVCSVSCPINHPELQKPALAMRGTCPHCGAASCAVWEAMAPAAGGEVDGARLSLAHREGLGEFRQQEDGS